ncbi:SIS domain-containing protein [Nitrosopumilus sp.]|nr:SIS domain-containing protein [Nitrosopumilus sp.]
MDISDLEKYDSKKMYEIYDEWPKIARKSFELEEESIYFENIDHIVFAGMGGSGALGDVFAAILSKTNIHVSIVKGYTLPKTVDSKTLVITSSVSGNTIETLTILKSTMNLSCKTISFSSGGQIEDYCKKNKLKYRKILFFHSPRASFVSFLFSMLKILKNITKIKNQDIVESIECLENIQKKISTKNLIKSNPALALAEWLTELPVIYYPHGLESSAIRFKNSLQENAKMHVITENVVEACHNGIVAWEKKSKLKPILIRGEKDDVKTIERWEILKEYFKSKSIEYYEINAEGNNIIAKIVYLIYFLDYASLYKAVLSEMDPSPVKAIGFIKDKIIENEIIKNKKFKNP